MRAMPRGFRRPRIPVTGAPAGPGSWHSPDPADTRGIARMTRSYEGTIASAAPLVRQTPDMPAAMLMATVPLE